MARKYKCQHCKEEILSNEIDTFVCETKVSEKGNKRNLYWHNDCYQTELARREFNLEELRQKDDMYETVKKLYNINFSPDRRWWEKVADMREGTNRFEKFWKKKYKKGVPFDVIKEAFILSKSDIEWARMSKKFKTVQDEMNYGLIIMQGKVNDAFRKMKTREQQEKMNEAMEQVQIEDMKDNREVSFKKTKRDDDYSYLLGDD